MSTGAVPKVKKSAKKKVHHVSSRYLQVGNASSGQDSGIVSSQEKSLLKSSKESNEDMTSTPVFKGEIPFPSLDASAVTNVQGHVTAPLLKERIVPTSTESVKKNLLGDLTMGPVRPSRKEKKDQFDEKIASAEMNIMYAEYLQSVFLEMEATKALEARSAAAAEILHKLLMLVQDNLDKVKSRRVKLKLMSSLINVQKHCEKQHAMLKPVYEVIPDVEEKYKSLSEAVNATKHKLKTKDVILSDPDELQQLLQKMDGFISDFFKAVPSFTKVISSSDVLQKYVDFGERLSDELKRAVGLITKAQELSISEAVLVFGC